MKVQSMKATHKVRKFKSFRPEGWKSKKISASYHRNLTSVADVTSKEEFSESMEYMNQWLNHPLFPQFI